MQKSVFWKICLFEPSLELEQVMNNCKPSAVAADSFILSLVLVGTSYLQMDVCKIVAFNQNILTWFNYLQNGM